MKKRNIFLVVMVLFPPIIFAQVVPPPMPPPPPPGLSLDGFSVLLFVAAIIYGSVKAYNNSSS